MPAKGPEGDNSLFHPFKNQRQISRPGPLDHTAGFTSSSSSSSLSTRREAKKEKERKEKKNRRRDTINNSALHIFGCQSATFSAPKQVSLGTS
jgi:hypothetical protein